MSLRNTLIACLACLAVGAALAKFLWPTIEQKVEIREKVVRQNDIQTVTKIVTRPDGTTESTSVTTDRSILTTDKQLTTTSAKKPQWNLGITAATNSLTVAPTYGMLVQRRVIGPVFVGASARTDGEFGLTLSMEF